MTHLTNDGDIELSFDPCKSVSSLLSVVRFGFCAQRTAFYSAYPALNVQPALVYLRRTK